MVTEISPKILPHKAQITLYINMSVYFSIMIKIQKIECSAFSIICKNWAAIENIYLTLYLQYVINAE